MGNVSLIRKHWAAVAMLAVGLLVSFVVFRATSSWETARAESKLERAAIHVTDAAQSELEKPEQSLRGFQGLYAASTSVDREEFAAYAQHTSDSGVQAMEWIPRVAASDREAFEALAIGDGFDDFVIRERSENGELIRADGRDTYYPAFYLEPFAGNEAAFGFDLGSESNQRAALEAARDSGSAASVLVQLVQERGSQTGVLLFMPIYQTGVAPDTVAERRVALAGFVLGVYQVGDLLSPALALAEQTGLELRLQDVTDLVPTEIITGIAVDSGLSEASHDLDAEQSRRLRIADRTWMLAILHDHNAAPIGRPWLSIGTAGGSALIFALLSAYLNSILGRTRRVEEEVHERTSELRDMATSHEQLAVSLAQREQRLDAILNTAADPIIGISERGVIESFNRAAEREFGYSADEVIGQRVEILMPASIGVSHPQSVNQYVETGRATTVVGQIRDDIAKRKDGSEFPIQLSVSEVNDGDRRIFTGIIRDMTAIKEAERGLARQAEELRAANQTLELHTNRLTAILNTAADAIIGISERGIIEHFNAAAVKMFGYEPGDVIGQRVEILMPGSTAEAHPESLNQYVKTGRATTVVGQVRDDIAQRKDGTEFPIQLAVSEVVDGEHRTFTGIVRDMTSIKTAERELLAREQQLSEQATKLQESNTRLEWAVSEAEELAEQANSAAATKADFLATMSHEIRTPMNGVIGMTGLLLGTELDEEQSQYANAIRSSGEALLSLINDILDFSKIESGHVEFESAPFSLRDTIYEISELLSHREDVSGLDLVVRYPSHVPHQVVGDAGRLRQILLNLGSNAIKFTAAGHVVFSVDDMGERADGAHYLRVSVSDTGLGIPADRLDAIFEEFTQVDASTTRTHGGTGLGLAIVRQIVEAMDGLLSVDSTLGEGSTFSFEIPLLLQEQQPEELVPASVVSARVVVVSENDIARSATTDQIAAWGIDVESAASPEEAARLLDDAKAAGQPFDIAICDCADVTAAADKLDRLRTSCPQFVETKVVLIVSADERAGARLAPDVAAVITRPPHPSRLMDALATALGARPASELNGEPSEEAQAEASLGVRVLVAEDNAVNQLVAQRMLEKLGCRVDIVANGREAVEAVASTPYDIVFMDCQMPEMDGYEATHEIRQGSHQSDIPIVAMTANAMEGDRERCLAAGMDDYVAKPVTLKVLPPVLDRWLKRHEEEVA
ncbi:MAG: PAS domain S-box protein [Dehalococcoidia bacterium]|nr:PAS domain S-box protein [Dehalococcoidia bacterium]